MPVHLDQNMPCLTLSATATGAILHSNVVGFGKWPEREGQDSVAARRAVAAEGH